MGSYYPSSDRTSTVRREGCFEPHSHASSADGVIVTHAPIAASRGLRRRRLRASTRSVADIVEGQHRSDVVGEAIFGRSSKASEQPHPGTLRRMHRRADGRDNVPGEARSQLALLASLPADGRGSIRIRGLEFRPTRALRRRDPRSSRCAHLAALPRLQFRRSGLYCPPAALRDLPCTAPEIGKLPDERCELLLKLFVPMLSTAPGEFKERGRMHCHGHR
jgi:hypothetical protein